MQDPAFPALSTIACLLLLPPLISQVYSRGRNVALLFYMTWIAVALYISCIHSFIWRTSINDVLPIWCDITTKLMLGASIGVSGSAMCIMRKLERIASTRCAAANQEEQRWNKIFELSFGIAVPLIYMALHTVNQGHRYDIIEEVGCSPALYMSLSSLFLFFLPPLVLDAVTTLYAGLALRHFWIRKQQFEAVLSSRVSGLDTSKYLRLIAMVLGQMALGFPLQITAAVLNLTPTGSPGYDFPQPYPSWAFVHEGFDARNPYRAAELVETVPRTWIALLINRYLLIWAALMVFIFFGLSADARRGYSQAFSKLSLRLRSAGSRSKKPESTRGSLPDRPIATVEIVSDKSHWLEDSSLSPPHSAGSAPFSTLSFEGKYGEA